ncbi:sodium:proton antiporter [Blastochloris viridis]|uniref:Citrate transporter n=1 Tax=Blastochloris viridis TaxID=1079 RepID=A0A0H5BB98_BLAVI|nr:sodium:proton antiporter [Blastochloris viridis]ALK10513.1 Citrate transporter [Blastochloris viridis]BAR99537.1 probable transmembrane protein [Blastochloris viridis]CUU43175.1 Citrate transporter [Blastochloris viridis]
MPILAAIAIAVLGSLCFAEPAFAAAALDGTQLSIWWALPFAGILLSIATGPLLFPHIWEHHYGKIAAGWALLAILPMALVFGANVALEAVLTVVLHEYVSFIILLFALFTIAGGILVKGELPGTPATNVAILTIGTVMASIVGTTGASMILIRPILRANQGRPHNVHVVVFFILLVSNIGGALTPLGDPPLFVGFLRGIDFFWTTTNLLHETLFAYCAVIAIFYVLDSYFYRREHNWAPPPKAPTAHVDVSGLVNIILLAGVIAAILMSAMWKPGIEIPFPGGVLELQNLVRDVCLVLLALASLKLTAREVREGNGFEWEPIKEVAKLFAVIFICIVPVIALLRAGEDGIFAPLINLVTKADGSPDNMIYFWATGLLSAFLDNAPTYLVFFELAGGDPPTLMGPLAGTLAAISLGAVYMGALTYIGNAPNFMVYAIARHNGIRMPSFFGYMLWSMAVLMPVLVAISVVFLR